MALSVTSVLITGASRGLGLEFVKQYLALPSAPEVIIATCRDPTSATSLQDIAKSHSCVKVIKLDVQKDEDIENAYKETAALVGDRGLNILINNAGQYDNSDDGGIYKTSRERMQRHFDVNVSGPVMIAQKFLPLVKMAAEQKSSKDLNSQAAVIMISSAMGSQTLTFDYGRGTSVHYKCSKTATTMATVLLARELREAGIYVAAIHPGRVKTDMGSPSANITKEDSIACCLEVISAASEETHGKLVNRQGQALPF
ncbi:RNA-directed DNA polymerase from mobile element jockey [Plakobranchus ocellatus]|uniref:RNA-directed DNA polymerase from mobile element jockey n=1 Tax=Plakobranchus ocellatus TaxID=259542 RepID=A0AAV4AN85_9GAST|nr:RNA-directed DNA polymerase from mobile element jockey [Plakobranchus ocellatus]